MIEIDNFEDMKALYLFFRDEPGTYLEMLDQFVLVESFGVFHNFRLIR